MEMEKEDVPSYLRAEPPAPEVDLDLPSAPQGSENQVYPERVSIFLSFFTLISVAIFLFISDIFPSFFFCRNATLRSH